MIEVNALGDACPTPVVKTKKALDAMKTAEDMKVLVDNPVAVENVSKFAKSKGLEVSSEKISEKEYHISIHVEKVPEKGGKEETILCPTTGLKGYNHVVAIASDKMGEGSEELGRNLLKAFIYALTEQDERPKAILFYNGGAKVSCEGSPSLDDLKKLESEGVEILTCGTCLNYYGIQDKLAVGEVTNMYSIVEHLMEADSVIKP